MLIERHATKLVEKTLLQGLIAIVYGPRQVGKTTLVKSIVDNTNNSKYYTCDDPNTIRMFQKATLAQLEFALKGIELLVIDEAQRITDIGLTAKLIHDNILGIKIILTGSSSLDLANIVNEPLTGRSRDIIVYPLSLDEIGGEQISYRDTVNRQLIYGGYPAIWLSNNSDAADKLQLVATQYLFKDTLSYQTVFDQYIINDLVLYLAYQIGSELYYSAIANKLNISKDTVVRYISLLEKAFIVFRVQQYRKKKNAEIGRLRKVYFYDLGIRNALIGKFDDVDIRDDMGALWENYCLIERRKKYQRDNIVADQRYWRARDGQEVDLIETIASKSEAYEFKFGVEKIYRTPRGFAATYPEIEYKVINPENVQSFL